MEDYSCEFECCILIMFENLIGIFQNEVIKPTINGLISIMKACLDAKTVRRLVFTSSAGTVNVGGEPKLVYDETCWSDVEFCRRVKMTGWVSTLSNFFDKIIIKTKK